MTVIFRRTILSCPELYTLLRFPRKNKQFTCSLASKITSETWGEFDKAHHSGQLRIVLNFPGEATARKRFKFSQHEILHIYLSRNHNEKNSQTNLLINCRPERFHKRTSSKSSLEFISNQTIPGIHSTWVAGDLRTTSTNQIQT